MRKFIQTMSTVALLAMIAGQPLWAASTKDDLAEPKCEVKSLKEGQTAMQRDLADIKKLLAEGVRAAPSRPAFKPTDITTGSRMGIIGTPAFVLGVTDPKDPNKAKVTEFISGARSLEKFSQVIEVLQKQAEAGE